MFSITLSLLIFTYSADSHYSPSLPLFHLPSLSFFLIFSFPCQLYFSYVSTAALTIIIYLLSLFTCVFQPFCHSISVFTLYLILTFFLSLSLSPSTSTPPWHSWKPTVCSARVCVCAYFPACLVSPWWRVGAILPRLFLARVLVLGRICPSPQANRLWRQRSTLNLPAPPNGAHIWASSIRYTVLEVPLFYRYRTKPHSPLQVQNISLGIAF